MYFLRFTVPKLTSVTNPHEELLPFAPGYLERFRLVFPTGCADLVGVWVEYRGARLLPINDDGYFVGNGGTIDFEMEYDLTLPPHELKIRSYNDDDTYEHSPTVGFKIRFVGSFEDEKEKSKTTISIGGLPTRD